MKTLRLGMFVLFIPAFIRVKESRGALNVYDVSLDTSNIAASDPNAPYYLDFTLLGGSSNTASIYNFTYGGGQVHFRL